MAESFSFGQWGETGEAILCEKFPLHRACRDGDVECLSVLLKEAQHGIYEEDSFYGWTPTHWAAYFGRLGCLQKLISITRVGIDCNICSSRFSQTPVHLVAFGGHPKCLEWLLHSGANPNMTDYLGETPVHKAARTGSLECVQLLAAQGARLYISNNSNAKPADVARMCGHLRCAEELEAAERLQDRGCAGVFVSSGIPPSAAVTPSQFDITQHPNHLHPSQHPMQQGPTTNCLVAQGINGGCLPPSMKSTPQLTNPLLAGMNGATGDHIQDGMDCDMEHSNLQELSNGDVTLCQGISNNQVPVAGRKRCLDSLDGYVPEIKRTRSEIFMETHHPEVHESPSQLDICSGNNNNNNMLTNNNNNTNDDDQNVGWQSSERFGHMYVGGIHGVEHNIDGQDAGQGTIHVTHSKTSNVSNIFISDKNKIRMGGFLAAQAIMDSGGFNSTNNTQGSSFSNSALEHQSSMIHEQGYDNLISQSMFAHQQ